MPASQMGIDVTRVDASALFPVGYETGDPRGGVFAGNVVKYVRANGTVGTNDAVVTDHTFGTTTERHATVVSVTAVAQILEGVSDLNAGMTSGQFGWITVKGRALCKTTGVADVTANRKLGTAAAVGTLGLLTATTPTAAEVIAAIAAANGKGASALTNTGTPVANQSFILLS